MVATGSPTDKHAILRVKLAIDAAGSSVDETRGVSVRLMGVTAPAAALSLGPCAGRTEHVAVFGRNGAVDVVSVPANSEPAVVSKVSRHAPDATALLCNLDHFDRVPPRGDITEIVSATDDATNPSYILATGGALTRVALGVATSVVPVSPPGFESVTSMWGLRFGCESLLVLSFSEQTRVFAVTRGRFDLRGVCERRGRRHRGDHGGVWRVWRRRLRAGHGRSRVHLCKRPTR